jgi:PAS domain S-box-containing protein
VLPEWNTISRYGSERLPDATGIPDLAIAEIDPAGFVRSVNQRGKAVLGWQAGEFLPGAMMVALKSLSPDEPMLLPTQPPELHLLGVRLRQDRGWLLVGYGPDEVNLGAFGSSFKSLIERIPVLIVRMRADGTVLYINAEASRMTGFAPEDIIGHPFWIEAVHSEDRWKLMGAMRRVLLGSHATVNLRFLTQSQALRFAEMHLYPASTEQVIEGFVFDVTEQSEVEATLMQSEALHRIFLEQSPLGVIHLDAEATVTFENHSFRRIIGEAPEDAWIGKTLYDIGGLGPDLLASVAGMLGQGNTIEAEEVVYEAGREQSGKVLTVNGSPIRQPGGAIVGAVLFIEDVTKQRQQDESLRLHARYSGAEGALRQVALATRAERPFLDGAARVLGETATAETVRILVRSGPDPCCASRSAWSAPGMPEAPPLRVCEGEFPLLDRAAARQRPLHLDALHKSRSARSLLEATGDAEMLVIPFFDEAHLEGYVFFERVRPPSEQWSPVEQHAMEKLVRLFETLWAWILADSRYRHTISTIDDALFTFAISAGGGRKYLLLTPQIEKLTGYEPAKLLSRGADALDWMESIVHPSDQPHVQAHEDALREGRDSSLSYRIRDREGAERWLRERSTPRRNEAGTVTVSGILSDVTDQKLAEQTLLDAKQEAESASQLKTAFIATLSHEIRTPLGAVNGFAGLLAQELSEFEERSGNHFPSQITEFVSSIRDKTHKLLTLVNDLFDLANMETGHVKPRHVSVPAHEVIARSAGKVAVTLAQKGVDLRTRLETGDPVVLGDPGRIEQVMDNLLSNAAKFTEEGAVTVTTRRDNGLLVVEVADTGVGIAPEYVGILFTPFMQEDMRLNRRFEGTGLGLALVKRLLDKMGGRIEVESEKGVGSVFRVFLELAG